jgi:hypothetical protein
MLRQHTSNQDYANGDGEKEKYHKWELCEKCKELGYNCKDYQSENEDRYYYGNFNEYEDYQDYQNYQYDEYYNY